MKISCCSKQLKAVCEGTYICEKCNKQYTVTVDKI